jgi:3-phenylpropionate/trans-cinnamate dioxygenase ferredoxin component
LRYRVASTEALRDGRGVAVDVGERRIALFRYQNELFALDETCPHRGGPLHEGEIESGVVLCPWHQWRFDLRSGCSPLNPLSKVRTYPVEVVGTEVWVEF